MVIIVSFNNATTADLEVLPDLLHVPHHEITVAVVVLGVVHIQQLHMDHPIVLVHIHDSTFRDAVDLVEDVGEREAFVVHRDLIAPDPRLVNSRSVFLSPCIDHASFSEPVRPGWHALCMPPAVVI